MRLWAKDKTGQVPEGKFLVVRRDGTVPAWPHFVLGARDPAAPAALRAYAEVGEKYGMDPAFIADIRELADDFIAYREQNGDGDPDARPHRIDAPSVIAAMRGAFPVEIIVRRGTNK